VFPVFRDRKEKIKIIRRVIFNQKGGVGKTTITCNLAAISAVYGKKTLVIDLDQQCNSTHYLLGRGTNDEEYTISDYFEELLRIKFRRKNFDTYIHKTPFSNLHIIPSHPDLGDLHGKLETRYKMFKLRDSLDSLTQFDYIYIDTPPALNFFTRSALIASDSCLIPFDCDSFSRSALYSLMENVNEIQQDHNSNLEIEGIIVNQFQQRAKFPAKIVSEMIADGLPVIDTYLSSSIKIRESHDKALPMAYMDARHKLTRQFEELYCKLNSSSDKNKNTSKGKSR